MTMGTISTIIIATIIGMFFVVGIRKLVRKFTKGESDCCGTSGCSGCSCHCNTPIIDKKK